MANGWALSTTTTLVLPICTSFHTSPPLSTSSLIYFYKLKVLQSWGVRRLFKVTASRQILIMSSHQGTNTELTPLDLTCPISNNSMNSRVMLIELKSLKNAFLYKEAYEEKYIKPPTRSSWKVSELCLSIHGLKKSPKAWCNCFSVVLKQFGTSFGEADHFTIILLVGTYFSASSNPLLLFILMTWS